MARVSDGEFSLDETIKVNKAWNERKLLPKLLPRVPGERDTAVKQAVAFRQADSLLPLWQVFWMTLMECGWKDRLTLTWTMLRELQAGGMTSY